MLVAEFAQAAQAFSGHDADAALALDRLDHDRGGLRPDCGQQRVMVAESDLIEPLDFRTESFEIFLLSAGGDRRQSTAVERALEGDDAEAFGVAADGLVFARHFNRAFIRLGAGIGEKDRVRESRVDQPLRQPLAFRDAVEVGAVPDFLRLIGQRLDKMGMRIAQRGDGDAAAEIKIARAISARQPCPLAALESDLGARVSRQQGRGGGYFSLHRHRDHLT